MKCKTDMGTYDNVSIHYLLFQMGHPCQQLYDVIRLNRTIQLTQPTINISTDCTQWKLNENVENNLTQKINALNYKKKTSEQFLNVREPMNNLG